MRRHHFANVLLHQCAGRYVFDCLQPPAAPLALEQLHLGVRALLHGAVGALAAVDAQSRALDFQGAVHAGIAAISARAAAAHVCMRVLVHARPGEWPMPHVSLHKSERRGRVDGAAANSHVRARAEAAQRDASCESGGGGAWAEASSWQLLTACDRL